MLELFLRIVAAFIPGSKRRKLVKAKIRSWHYSKDLRKKAKISGSNPYCGGPVHIYCNNIELGNHAAFNGACLLGRGSIKIGNYFHSGFGLVIMTENHNYEGNAIPYDDTFIVKDVEIGNCVWIGINVTILPGSKIGNGAIIQAGSVVHGTIPDYAIAGGNPAKVFSHRDQAHYNERAAANAFH